jgi:hypothetical protein
MRTGAYKLVREDAFRLVAIIKRHGGFRTLRDLDRRHRFWKHMIDAAEYAGIIQIETRKKRTGRPSVGAIVAPGNSEQNLAANLPLRKDRMQTLTFPEELFCLEYYCRRGMSCSFFGMGRGSHSAADAYRRVYGRRHRLTAASARSAGSRLARRPWMKAGWLYCLRVFKFNQFPNRGCWFPDDMRSDDERWLKLLRWIEWEFTADWTPAIRIAIGFSKNFPEACEAMKRVPLTDKQKEDLSHISGEWLTNFLRQMQAERIPLRNQ